MYYFGALYFVDLNLPNLISTRISQPKSGSFAATSHKVAVLSIGVGLAVMMVAYFIMLGFQNTIKNKIYDFTGQIQITRYVTGNAYNDQPVSLDTTLTGGDVARVVPFAYMFGLIQEGGEVEGAAFKGIGPQFDSLAFLKYLVSGNFIRFKEKGSYSSDIIISELEANKLKLDVGSEVVMHFIQSPPRSRKLLIRGIYSTGMEDFDKQLIIGDIGLVRRLNNWADSLAGGYEVYLSNPGATESVYASLYNSLGYNLQVQRSSNKYIQIFEWLSLINNNVNLLIFMVLFVASFNMISIVLILIIERTPMIGTLKALGASDGQIRSIFRHTGSRLIVKGLLLGNGLGLGFSVLQHYFKIIPLDPTNYYMSYVPIQFDWWVVLFLNVLVFVIVSLILLIPTMVISRIQPIKAIRFD